jgi:hypothetical protein
LRILSVQQEHLRADGVGVLILDLRARKMMRFCSRELIDVVIEPEAARGRWRCGIGSRARS